MNYTYKVYYSLLCELNAAQRRDRDMVITAISPIRALDIFHKNLQNLQEKSANGVVLRPKLTASDYAIKSFVQRYTDEVKGAPWIESPIDLPSTPNPELGAKPAPVPEHSQGEMPLDDARKPAEVKHEEAAAKVV